MMMIENLYDYYFIVEIILLCTSGYFDDEQQNERDLMQSVKRL